jgi:type II secretory pathway predicted ATPase ExeA/septal ring-binding cell division protein DamX
MYEEYFGLSRSPFKITPDTSLFYEGGHRGDILGALVYAVHRGEGIIKVVGEVGSGKTMLCRMLQQELPENIEIVYIANPSVSPEDILFVIASELKFDVDRDASKHELVTMLHEYLLQRHAEDRQVVLFVEEAQGMPLETLEEIRLLSNLETEQHKLMQMILFGQPELDENLSKKSIRQLRERITHDFQLGPLGGAEIHQYLNFRMREVGYTGPELISRKLADSMVRYSEGLLRRINILADKMLLSAFADGTHTLTLKHLKAAVKDSGFTPINQPAASRKRWWWMSASAVLILAVLAYGWTRSPYFDAFQLGETVSSAAPADVPTVPAAHVQPAKNASPDQSVETTRKEPAQPASLPDSASEAAVEPAASAVIENKNVESPPENEQTAKIEIPSEMTAGSKKNQQSADKLDKVNANQPVKASPSSKKYNDYQAWLKHKIQASKDWLRNANKQSVSIQVMMRSKSAAEDLVKYLQTEWPLELDKTYVYEVTMNGKEIYRVFYNEYPSITQGQIQLKQLPQSIRVNSPYLHSVYRMQKALL